MSCVQHPSAKFDVRGTDDCPGAGCTGQVQPVGGGAGGCGHGPRRGRQWHDAATLAPQGVRRVRTRALPYAHRLGLLRAGGEAPPHKRPHRTQRRLLCIHSPRKQGLRSARSFSWRSMRSLSFPRSSLRALSWSRDGRACRGSPLLCRCAPRRQRAWAIEPFPTRPKPGLSRALGRRACGEGCLLCELTLCKQGVWSAESRSWRTLRRTS
jgi:hypothetical protein